MVEDNVDVADNPDEQCYELRVDGVLAGIEEYEIGGGIVALVSTEIFDDFTGRGLGDQLIAFALDDVRERDLMVQPDDAPVRRFIDRHPEYEDLVAD